MVRRVMLFLPLIQVMWAAQQVTCVFIRDAQPLKKTLTEYAHEYRCAEYEVNSVRTYPGCVRDGHAPAMQSPRATGSARTAAAPA